MTVIKVCKHCQDTCSGDYCRKCSTLEKRIAQDEANRINFEENGLSYESPCKKCKTELEVIEKNNK
jgi:hypothetical protein